MKLALKSVTLTLTEKAGEQQSEGDALQESHVNCKGKGQQKSKRTLSVNQMQVS